MDMTSALPRRLRKPMAIGTTLLAALSLTGLGAVPSAGAATSTEVLYGVSCSGAICVAVGSTSNSGGTAVLAKSWNYGVKWSLQNAPASVSALRGVACATTTNCFAVGQTTSNGPAIDVSPASGPNWSAQTPPAADGELTSVSCVTTTECWTGGYSSGGAAGAVAKTTDGSTWTPESVPGGSTGVAAVSGMACKGTGTAHCYATGYWVHYFEYPYLMRSNSARTSWSDTPIETTEGGSMSGVSCHNSTVCVAVGQVNGAAYVLSTSNGGTAWTAEPSPSGFTQLAGVSCIGAATCVAVGTASGGVGGIAISTNLGKTWTVQTVPAGTGALTSVSCTSTTRCAAVGSETAGGPAVLTTSNGGKTWSAATFPA